MDSSIRPLYERMYLMRKDGNDTILATVDSEDEQAYASMVEGLGVEQLESDIEILRGDFSIFDNEQMLLNVPAGYHKSLKEYAGINFINDVDKPTLVLQPSTSFEADIDLQLYKDGLADNENCEFKLYDQLDHYMISIAGKTPEERFETKGVVEQFVIDDICNFILKH